jgi:hypothetical protein
MSKNAKQLAEEIEVLHSDLVKAENDLAKNPGYHPQVASICSRLMARQAQLTELSTRRLIHITWVLLLLTIALFLVEVRAVFFPKDSATHIEAKQAGQNYQIVIPAITNTQHTK